MMMNERHFGAIWALELKAKPKLVLLALAALADNRGARAVDMPALRAMACLRGDAIQEQLDDLEQRGLVITERPATAGDTRIVYTLPFAAERKQS